jgi:hypothetical protein
MYWFWDPVIRPLLEHVEPDVVVEIGSDQGLSTRNLIAFCRRRDADETSLDLESTSTIETVGHSKRHDSLPCPQRLNREVDSASALTVGPAGLAVASWCIRVRSAASVRMTTHSAAAKHLCCSIALCRSPSLIRRDP